MKSNTVRFNVYTLLSTAILAAAAYATFPGISLWAFTALTVLGILASQAITFFSPSGAFVGQGQNWTAGKWISRIGLSVLSIFGALESHGWLVQAIAIATPLIEIIIRMYGSNDEATA